MIGRFQVQRLFAAMSSQNAIALLKSVAQTYGFEAETIPLKTATRRTFLVQMHQTPMPLDSAAAYDFLPLVLPMRLVICEISSNSSIIYFPDWNGAGDAETIRAKHCMKVLYRAAMIQVSQALIKSFKSSKSVNGSIKDPIGNKGACRCIV